MQNVVVQFGNKIVKGHTDAEAWFHAAAADGKLIAPQVQVKDGSKSQSISLDGAKGVFFVKSFEGNSREDLRFSDHLEPLGALWVRITYLDGEVIEGIIRNDSEFALRQHFFMAPVDPEGNNTMVLVIKSQLTNFQVLGLRSPSPDLPMPLSDITASPVAEVRPADIDLNRESS